MYLCKYGCVNRRFLTFYEELHRILGKHDSTQNSQQIFTNIRSSRAEKCISWHVWAIIKYITWRASDHNMTAKFLKRKKYKKTFKSNFGRLSEHDIQFRAKLSCVTFQEESKFYGFKAMRGHPTSNFWGQFKSHTFTTIIQLCVIV